MSHELSDAGAAFVFDSPQELRDALSRLPTASTGAAASSYVDAALDRRLLADRFAAVIGAL